MSVSFYISVDDVALWVSVNYVMIMMVAGVVQWEGGGGRGR